MKILIQKMENLVIVGRRCSEKSVRQTRKFGRTLTVTLVPKTGNDGKAVIFRRFPMGLGKVRLVDDRKGTHKCWLLVVVPARKPPKGSSAAVRALNPMGKELSVSIAYLSM